MDIAYIVAADQARSVVVAMVVVGLIVEAVARAAVVEASSVPMVVDLDIVVVARWVDYLVAVDLDHSTTWLLLSLLVDI